MIADRLAAMAAAVAAVAALIDEENGERFFFTVQAEGMLHTAGT
jgi:hypothetical protein